MRSLKDLHDIFQESVANLSVKSVSSKLIVENKVIAVMIEGYYGRAFYEVSQHF